MKSFAKHTVAVVCLLSVWGAALPRLAQSQSQPQNPSQSAAQAATGLRPEVHKLLLQAQQALERQQIEQALQWAAQAAAVSGLSATEQQWVWRLQAVLALRAQQWTLAIERLEGLLALPQLPTAERPPLQEMLVNAAIQNKDLQRTIRVAQQYLQAGGTQAAMRNALLQSLSAAGEHARLVQEMHGFVAQDRAQQRKTPEAQLRWMGAAMLQLKDPMGYFSVLKLLLEHYPSKAYWADAISRLSNLPQFDSRYELDAYRLLLQTDNLEEAAEHREMAELALKAGLPALAVRVLQAGQSKAPQGQGAEAEQHKRLLQQAQKKVQEDDALLPQLASSAKDGNEWMALAQAYADRQQWAQAATAYDKALSVGGLRRAAQARLHLGVALFHSGQKQAALDQWARLQTPSEQAPFSETQLAALWTLLAR